MSDRALITGAIVPMVCGALAMILLQRAPVAQSVSAPEPKTGGAVTATSILPATELRPAVASQKAWVGVVVPSNTAELAADTDARIVQVFVTTGAHVKPGDKLLQLDPSDSQNAVGVANAQLSQRVSDQSRAQARVDAAAKQLSRLRSGAMWLSAKELDQANAELQVANAELAASRAAVNVGHAQLRQQRLVADRRMLTAPFAGTVVDLGVDPGDSVRAGQVVMRILSDGREVRFAYPPGQIPETGARNVVVELDGSNTSLVAQVTSTRPEVDPSARLVIATVPLPAGLPQSERFLPGSPVQVFLAPP
jgi:multidrug efflux pump subunit AcrA (membrane-fusion protein)